MNIFKLDEDPILAAQMQCDKHVVKMILESAQLLSTAHRLLDGKQTIYISGGRRVKRWKLDQSRDEHLYKATHINHPSNIWAREDVANYQWLYKHFEGLSKEYEFRYEREHLSWTKLKDLLSVSPDNIPSRGCTPLRLAMPDEYRSENVVQSYRSYYKSKRDRISMQWTKRSAPEWFNG